jgi:hypothetical protein
VPQSIYLTWWAPTLGLCPSSATQLLPSHIVDGEGEALKYLQSKDIQS